MSNVNFFSYSASGCPIACKNKEKYQSHATSGITYAEKFGGSTYPTGNGSSSGGMDGSGGNDSDTLKDKGDQPMDTSEEGHPEEKVNFLIPLTNAFRYKIGKYI